MSKDNILKFNQNLTNKEKSMEYYYKALEAKSNFQMKKLLKEAISLDPNNTSAELVLIDFEEDPIKKIEKLYKLEEIEKQNLEKGNYFEKDNIGDFWLIFETRTYIRILYAIALTSMKLGNFKNSIDYCEKIIKLNANDNLGTRYLLFSLYCYLEDYKNFDKLRKKYDEESTSMTFIEAIKFYKQGKYKESKIALKKLKKTNPFIIAFILPDDFPNKDDLFMYNNFEEYEIDILSDEAVQLYDICNFLFMSLPCFLLFVHKVI